MIKPTVTGPAEGSFQSIPGPLPVGRFEERKSTHSPLELHARRLRYFLDLLETGYRHALQPDPLARSLRGERIALGIDVPELDTVPLWSMKRADGAVAIPFVEFIVEEICGALAAIAEEAGQSGGVAGEDLILAGSSLQRLLDQAGPSDASAAPGPPRLGDVFLPHDLVEEICGPQGLLVTMTRQCEALLAVEPGHPGH